MDRQQIRRAWVVRQGTAVAFTGDVPDEWWDAIADSPAAADEMAYQHQESQLRAHRAGPTKPYDG